MGSAAGLGQAAQLAADLDARHQRQHPVEHDEIGHLFGDLQHRLLAVARLGDAEALALEVVAQQGHQGGLVFDHQDQRGLRHALFSGGVDHGEACLVALRPGLGDVLAAHQEVDDLGDVGGVVADALDVLGDEQQMGGGADVARVFHHVGQQLAEQAVVHVVDLLVALPGGDRPCRRRCR